MEINISDLIFAAVNFLILVAVLTALLLKPVTKILDERKSLLEGQRDEAEKMLAEAAASVESNAKALENAHKKAEDIIKKAVNDGDVQKTSMLMEAKEKTEVTYLKAQENISAEITKAQAELKNEALTLGIHVAKKLLKNTVQVSSTNRVEEFINDISDAQSLKTIENSLDKLKSGNPVRVVSTKPLSAHEAQLVDGFLKQAGAKETLVLDNATDEDLLGGIIVFIGSLMLDGSVSKQLSNIGAEVL
ncbi:MAG: F0F1 ATP synthase subunit delta [Oscillospiraceae bacterium]